MELAAEKGWVENEKKQAEEANQRWGTFTEASSWTDRSHGKGMEWMAIAWH